MSTPVPPADVPELAILRAEPQDLPGVEALQRRTFTNPWGIDAIRWELEHTDVARLYVMRAPLGPVIAYCACWLVFDELHINSLAVDETWRRRGLAVRLLRVVIAEAVAGGARSATLEVRRSNDAARALYEGLGFRVEAVRRDYYQHPREDALILWHRGLAEAAAPATPAPRVST
jgi:ribosomal-protein-alanine N-acetyltransferase